MNFSWFKSQVSVRSQRWHVWLLGALAVGSVSLVACVFADRAIARNSRGRIAGDPATAQPADVALVLGTAKIVHGRPNFFYEARLDAAATLFRTGRVRGILVSGDNSRRSYDEPTDMKRDLVSRGVPAEFVTCDYAGFSTLDSMQRAKRVFGQTRVVVVSQRFHVERALYLADAAELEASGFAAADAPRWWAVRTRIREVLARGKAVLDVALGRGPKFLGPPETVVLAGTPPVEISR